MRDDYLSKVGINSSLTLRLELPGQETQHWPNSSFKELTKQLHQDTPNRVGGVFWDRVQSRSRMNDGRSLSLKTS